MHFPTLRIAFILATEIVQEHLREVLVAVLTFSLMAGVFLTMVNEKMHTLEEQSAAKLSISIEQLQQKTITLFTDPEKQREIMHALYRQSDREKNSKDTSLLLETGVITNYLVYLFLNMMLLSIVIAILFSLAWIFFVHRFLAPEKPASATVLSLPYHLCRLFLLKCWMMFRSFFWLFPPTIFYYAPRFFFAPILLMQAQTHTVFSSLRESMKRVKGHYFEVCKHLLFLTFLISIDAFFSLFIASAIALFSPKIATLCLFAALFFSVSFIAAYQVALMGEGE